MSLARSFKFVLALLIGLGFASFLLLHALSSVLTSSSPTEAVMVYPWNGVARSNLAFENFSEAVAKGIDSESSASGSADPTNLNPNAVEPSVLEIAAQQSTVAVVEAIRSEPLSPKAYAILALAETDPLKKNQIIERAGRLSKRELTLQNLMLAKNISEQNYPGTIETIDQILRSHPRRASELFRVLVAALSVDDTIPQFTQLLSKPLPWRDNFLNYALRSNEALDNLAAIRANVSFDNEDIDKRLIGRLADQGRLIAAGELYQAATRRSPSLDTSATLDWNAAYPPFDWALASQRGLRARVDDDGKALSVSVSPGSGGVIASRFLTLPTDQFEVQIVNDLNLSSRLDNLKLQVACAGTKEPFVDKVIRRASQGVQIDARNQNCSAYNFILSARAWTGSSELEGTISSVSVSSLVGEPKL